MEHITTYISDQLKDFYPPEEIRSMIRILLTKICGLSHNQQILCKDTHIPEKRKNRIYKIVDRLKKMEPLQYILGETEFYNCHIVLSPATLIPRQETEELVDIIIKENTGYSGQIVDIGTGSGCIAVALAKNISGASVFGTDFSAEAIDIAKHNASINNVKIDFINEDIFKPSKIFLLNAGIIVSNPPYVRNSEKAFMHRNVLDYEPATALFVDDANPLVFYETILEIAVKILQIGGKIYFEINEALGSEMSDLLENFGYTDIKLINDINGKERFIKGTKNG